MDKTPFAPRGRDARRTQRHRRSVVLTLFAAAAVAGSAVAPAGPLAAQGTPEPVASPQVSTTACWTDEQRVDGGEDMAKQYTEMPAMRIDPAKQYSATLETNKGNIVVEFFPDDAPKTVNNFVCLAEDDYYDGTPFHRIVKGFVIQGGDPTGTGAGGPGYQFEDEPVSRDYARGTLAMANAGPNTNGSQFFVVLDDLQGKLPKNYTIFGQVTEGMDVVDAIANTPTSVGRTGEKSTPDEPIILQNVTVTES